jgi:hypothetical protein
LRLRRACAGPTQAAGLSWRISACAQQCGCSEKSNLLHVFSPSRSTTGRASWGEASRAALSRS